MRTQNCPTIRSAAAAVVVAEVVEVRHQLLLGLRGEEKKEAVEETHHPGMKFYF